MVDTYTLEELKEYIANQIDEVEILELLKIDSTLLVEKFSDEIETNYDYIISKLGLDDWKEGIND
jgi:hypothetical protein